MELTFHREVSVLVGSLVSLASSYLYCPRSKVKSCESSDQSLKVQHRHCWRVCISNQTKLHPDKGAAP